jgi:hypothetical protein
MYPFLFQNQFAPKIWLFLSLTFCLINSLQVIAKPVNSQPVAAQSASALPASSQSAGLIEISNQQEEEILAFVEKFRVAIIQKDKVGFLDLFLDTSMKWTDVLSDYTLDEVKVKRPEISKVSTGDPLEFINSIVKDPKTLEEKFYNSNRW